MHQQLVNPILVCIVLLPVVAKCSIPQKAETRKAPPLREKFDICKGSRPLNPVEAVRAQSYASKVFAKCGPNLIIKYAERYNFPAYGLSYIAHQFCFGMTVTFAFLSKDESLIIPKNVTKRQLLSCAE